MIRIVAVALLLSGCVGDTSVRALEERALPLFFDEARAIETGGPEFFFCLATARNGRSVDAPAAIVASRQEAWDVPVLPASRCRQGDDSLVYAEGTEGTGQILTVGDLSCQAGRGCSGWASYYAANEGAASIDVILQRTLTGFKIERSNVNFVS